VCRFERLPRGFGRDGATLAEESYAWCPCCRSAWGGSGPVLPDLRRICAQVGHPRHTELPSKADRLTENGDVNKLLSSYLAGRHAVCLPANY
jgi:hypothetical protein